MTSPNLRSDLKSCPFCKKRNAFVTWFPISWYVVCSECTAEGPNESSKQKAIQAWNTRKGEGR